MSHTRGVLVRLVTGDRAIAGTNDPIFLGVVGRGGAREFPIDVGHFDDFEREADVLYEFGTVWEWIELEDIDYLYVRKVATQVRRNGNAYRSKAITVDLCAREAAIRSKRTFSITDAVWSAGEQGQRIWIPEVENQTPGGRPDSPETSPRRRRIPATWRRLWGRS